jgi:hypothetical protein
VQQQNQQRQRQQQVSDLTIPQPRRAERVVPTRALATATRTRHLCQRLVPLLRIGARLELGRIGQTDRRKWQYGAIRQANRPEVRPGALHREARFERALPNPLHLQTLCGAVTGDNDGGRRGPGVRCRTTSAVGIELNPHDTFGAPPIERGLRVQRRIAAEQPSAEADGKRAEVGPRKLQRYVKK